jgi:hypothetical protein
VRHAAQTNPTSIELVPCEARSAAYRQYSAMAQSPREVGLFTLRLSGSGRKWRR